MCWSALWNMTRDALLPARDFIGLVLRFAGRESDIGVLQMLHAWAESAAVHYTAPGRREQAGRRKAGCAEGHEGCPPEPPDHGAAALSLEHLPGRGDNDQTRGIEGCLRVPCQPEQGQRQCCAGDTVLPP